MNQCVYLDFLRIFWKLQGVTFEKLGQQTMWRHFTNWRHGVPKYNTISYQQPSIHEICCGRRGHCPWSKKIHMEQSCSTWPILLVMWIKSTPHDEQFCTIWHNCLSCGAILLRGAMTNSIVSLFTHFCVEQHLIQTSCLRSKNDKFHVFAIKQQFAMKARLMNKAGQEFLWSWCRWKIPRIIQPTGYMALPQSHSLRFIKNRPKIQENQKNLCKTSSYYLVFVAKLTLR